MAGTSAAYQYSHTAQAPRTSGSAGWPSSAPDSMASRAQGPTSARSENSAKRPIVPGIAASTSASPVASPCSKAARRLSHSRSKAAHTAGSSGVQHRAISEVVIAA